MHQALSLHHEQRLALLPKMLQSIEVLQLATQDLLKLIDAEVEQNETLEATSKLDARAEGDGHERSADHGDDHGDDHLGHDLRSGGDSGERDRNLDLLHSIAADAGTLLDSVREQLAWLDLPPPLRDKVLALAERLDERGLLATSDAELEQALGGDLLAEAIRIVQCLEPRGIGARDPIGAMLLQVDPDDPDYTDIQKLLTTHLEELAKNKIPAIAKALGRPVEEVQGLVARIRLLNPQPAACFNVASGGMIRPDAVVRLVDGRIEVRVDDHELPMLGISADYAAMVRDRKASTEVKAYLRGKIASAKNLIRAVEQRRRTLARVVLAAMERQRQFLEQGRAGLAPLAMAEIATELGLHVSTVSRAIAGKHVQTDRGVFPLRELFDGGTGSASGPEPAGSATGRRGIRERVAELIRAEDSGRPLSDDDIVGLLGSRGIKVARRTVAKYRNELGIKTSFQRKSYRNGTGPT